MKKLFLILVSLISMAAVADEKSLYRFSWLDKDKEIYVLQNRKFRKDGKVYLGITGAKTMNGAFINAYGGTGRAGYFFREDWGVELVYGKTSGSENDTAKGVKEQTTVPYYRKIDSYVGGMVMWSPFYSKINTFNRIFYFDWMFGLGAASVTTKDNRNKFTPGAKENALTTESNMGVLWDTGLRFYINESWSIRADITGLHYSAKKTKQPGGPGKALSSSSLMFSNYDLGIGLNYTF